MILSPSICTSGYSDLQKTLEWIKANSLDRIHIDVMDGEFVKPIMGGTDYVNYIRDHTDSPLELHFMTYEPERMLDIYDVRKNEIIYVHADTTMHAHRLLQNIRDRGCVPGLALSYYDEVIDAAELLGECENVLLMGVKAGCPGSEFYWSVLEKNSQIKKLALEAGIEICTEVDGSVSPDNIEKIAEAGIDAVVLGYPGCFDKATGRDARLKLMKELLLKYT